MTPQLLLLSTCGTSVLTNGTSDDMRRWLNTVANKSMLNESEVRRLQIHVAERRGQLRETNATVWERASAELNGIGAVLARWKPDRVLHLLVHTDTAAGCAAMEIVAEALRADGHEVQPLTAGGLRTDDAASFREALAELTRDIENWVATHREMGWSTIFNLTGGFKSVNGYLQALGMLHADRCVFLFDGAPALMEIPRLPVRLAEADDVRKHLAAFRRLELGYPVAASQVAGLPDSLLLFDAERVTTSVWGDVVWARVRNKLFAETLLPPLSPKLKVDGLSRGFDKLPSDRRVMVNEALDALSADLDGVRPLLRSNTFKPLGGSPRPPSTHELYLWSDGAAWRLFGHYESANDSDAKVFFADSMGEHL